MINLEDYKSYKKANQKFLNLLEENSSLVYERLYDLLKVLGYIELQVDQNIKLSDELAFIFDVGYSFLHEQLEELKLYYSNYFNNDLILLLEKELFLNYILYIDDLSEVLKEKKKYTKELEKEFDIIRNEIDSILKSKEIPSLDNLENYDLIVLKHVPVGTLTTLEIFAMIVEELQI